MKLIPSQDERDLASMLSALLVAECPMSLVRELRDAEVRPMPEQLWKSLADAGVFGLLLPQEHGGADGCIDRPRCLLRGGRPWSVPDDRA